MRTSIRLARSYAVCRYIFRRGLAAEFVRLSYVEITSTRRMMPRLYLFSSQRQHSTNLDRLKWKQQILILCPHTGKNLHFIDPSRNQGSPPPPPTPPGLAATQLLSHTVAVAVKNVMHCERQNKRLPARHATDTLYVCTCAKFPSPTPPATHRFLCDVQAVSHRGSDRDTLPRRPRRGDVPEGLTGRTGQHHFHQVKTSEPRGRGSTSLLDSSRTHLESCMARSFSLLSGWTRGRRHMSRGAPIRKQRARWRVLLLLVPSACLGHGLPQSEGSAYVLQSLRAAPGPPGRSKGRC